MAHNWKEPETSTIYLANGEQVRAAVNGIAEDGSGSVLVHGREIPVAPLDPADTRYTGYGEVVSITLQSGEAVEAVLTPDDYSKHVTSLYWGHDSMEATICVYDQSSGTWREMTDEEYEKERHAWAEDMKDMKQIKREWREYREI